jgi:hypothetical protein
MYFAMIDLLAEGRPVRFVGASAGPETLAERFSGTWAGNRLLSARTPAASIARRRRGVATWRGREPAAPRFA